MTLNFENESDRQFGFDPEKIASAVCRAALEAVRCPYEAEVSLLITDGERNMTRLDHLNDLKILRFRVMPLIRTQESCCLGTSSSARTG